MLATSKDDVVITHRDGPTPGEDEDAPKESARRQWGSPAGTVLNMLQGKSIDTCSTISDDLDKSVEEQTQPQEDATKGKPAEESVHAWY